MTRQKKTKFKLKTSKIRWIAAVGILTVSIVTGCSGKGTVDSSSDSQESAENTEGSGQSQTSDAEKIYHGNVKRTYTLLMQGDNCILAKDGGDQEGQYYLQDDEEGKTIQYMDGEGNILLDVKSAGYPNYLGEGYILVEQEETEGKAPYGIYKENTSVYEFDMADSILDFKRNYADGIIMYTDISGEQVVLYDLNKGQEIVRLDGDSPTRDGNRMVTVHSSPLDPDYRIIYDVKTGEPISSTDPELTRRAADCGIYVETISDQYVTVFQEDGTKISELKLKEDETLTLLLNCGCYLVQGKNPDTSNYQVWQYHVYDRNSQWMCDLYIGNLYNFICTNENEYAVLDGEEGTSCVLFADGTVMPYNFRVEGTASVSNEIHYYALGSNWTGEGDDRKIGQEDLISLLTRKTMVASEGEEDEGYYWSDESKDGSYICIYRTVRDENYKSTTFSEIRDKDMNLVYGPEILNCKEFLDDENMVVGRGSKEDGDYELFILNLPTLKEYPLEVEGTYVSCNRDGIVTKDDKNYYIYQFTQ